MVTICYRELVKKYYWLLLVTKFTFKQRCGTGTGTVRTVTF
jgi:hypothetical protein